MTGFERKRTSTLSVIVIVSMVVMLCLSCVTTASNPILTGASAGLPFDLEKVAAEWTLSDEQYLGPVQMPDGKIRHLHFLQFDNPDPSGKIQFVSAVVDVLTQEFLLCAWAEAGEVVIYDKTSGRWVFASRIDLSKRGI